jgi:hypothetical protein
MGSLPSRSARFDVALVLGEQLNTRQRAILGRHEQRRFVTNRAHGVNVDGGAHRGVAQQQLETSGGRLIDRFGGIVNIAVFVCIVIDIASMRTSHDAGVESGVAVGVGLGGELSNRLDFFVVA